MGTIAQKLTYLEDTKTAIGNAIAAKGGSVTGKTFRQYATEISNLPSGGGGTPIVESIDVSDYTGGTSNFMPSKEVTKVNLPSGITSFGQYAFQNYSGLTSFTIPSTVTNISYSCFDGCSGLTSITIPSNVTSISDYAFKGCTGLTSFTIPDTVTSLGRYILQGATNITYLKIGSGVKTIAQGDFANLNITTLVLSEGLKTININAFESNKITSLTIPDSVTSISGGSCFRSNVNLSTITVGSNNTVYDSRNNCNAIIKTSNNELVVGCKSTVIPNTVTSIGMQAFQGHSELTSVTLPEGLTSIGEWAFQSCSKLSGNLTIPSTITTIGQHAFDFSGLSSLTIEATTPPTLGTHTSFPSHIYVPAESVDTYKAASNWSTYASRIQAIPSE